MQSEMSLDDVTDGALDIAAGLDEISARISKSRRTTYKSVE